MKVRRILQWCCLGIACILLAAWVGSRWFQIRYVNAKVFATVQQGELYFDRTASSFYLPSMYGWEFSKIQGEWRSKCSFQYQSIDAWQFVVPLWPVVIVCGGAGAVLWRIDQIASRRTRGDLCVKCGYDRRGIGAELACPECGEVCVNAAG